VVKKTTEQPLLFFESPKKWEDWLAKNHSKSDGVWLQFYKKASGKKTLVYDGALQVALCYGWIDGQSKSIDENSYKQKFTPRRSRSIWSKRNTEFAEKLIAEGKMKKAGLEQVEAAKKDGRWEKAYDSPVKMTMPEDFLKALSKNKKAKTFFESLNKTNTYAIAWRLQTAKKPETRAKRMKIILEMLENGKKFH